MRLHRLRATAFGPFAGTIDVDFDQLSTAGLFLLSGPTGAGKTSVLDAVCFALYGDVPGDRNAAKRLRSDLAAPGARPEVKLEATLSGRRFRITRSPAWERPKKRGDGMTTEQASVAIAERVHGAWVTQSTRLDETGHLVSRLLGMNVAQFTQVAMLPQGRFQAFLRARSEERHRLLQQLFRTGRFEDVEKWLRDRRLDLRRRAESARETVADLVSRVSETTGTQPPDDGPPEVWARTLLDTAGERCAETASAAAAAAETEERTRATLDEARGLHTRRARVDAAAAELRRLEAAADDHAEAVRRLDDARRAAGVAALHQVAVRARRSRSAARTSVERLPVADRDTLEVALREAVDGAARARALQPRVERLALVRKERAALDARRVQLTTAAQRALNDARERVTALSAQVDAARTAHGAARESTLQARTRALDVREARLSGMAAEMAGALAVGASCPVCGSCDHPHKAPAADGAPDEVAERTALKAADDAAATEHLRDVELRTLEAQLATAVEQVDVVPSAIATETGSVEASLAALEAEETGLVAELADHDESQLGRCAEHERTARSGIKAMDVLDAADAAVAEAEQAVTAAAVAAGFAGPDDALSAALDQREYDDLARRAADHDRRLAAVAAVLAEPGAEEVAHAELPDLPVLTDAHQLALRHLGEARAQESAWTTRAQRLGHLVTDLERAVAAWRPLSEELDVLTRLSAFVEGKSADNRLQMRLSAYVLAYRLAQVVAAANERLDRMSDRRYTLEHTGRRGAGETRGGLSLVVRDDWSGEARDPATLSGGETFVVSLALALGLADVVTQEVGGADLDTLFVDEGFGALDADTLDDVMDTLDSLRDGGRVVGVVSHVAEMRDRIPTQLLVSKSRGGSTVDISR
ncbi:MULTISPECIES: AAA family ATPase [unclassified Nocardioides]|uniref:AAA family ATPase n=1 Tax=unclassified Nocardioides TaxID=2615069 RepID=UPI00361C4367